MVRSRRARTATPAANVRQAVVEPVGVRRRDDQELLPLHADPLMSEVRLDGPETGQAQTFCRIAKRYIFPAVVIEDFDNRRALRNREYLAPVRVASKIEFCIQTGMAGQVTGHEWQMPSLAFETAPDDRLKKWGLYPPGPEHPKDATRHAITLIRRAKKDPKLARRIFHTFGQA